MNPGRPAPHLLQGLPTLTEVIEAIPARGSTPEGSGDFSDPPAVPAVAPDAPAPALADAAPLPPIDEEQLVLRVLTELQRHADLMLDYRLREALTPALARLSEALIRELRQELAATLRDVVARAVTQELARQRGRAQ